MNFAYCDDANIPLCQTFSCNGKFSIQLTITKKMADVQFARIHCARKLFKKANGRLLKARHKAGG